MVDSLGAQAPEKFAGQNKAVIFFGPAGDSSLGKSLGIKRTWLPPGIYFVSRRFWRREFSRPLGNVKGEFFACSNLFTASRTRGMGGF